MYLVTFRVWLADQVRRRDAIGEIARDVVSDDCLPLHAESYPAIKHHILTMHGASIEAEQALRQAAHEWGYTDYMGQGAA